MESSWKHEIKKIMGFEPQTKKIQIFKIGILELFLS